MTAYQQQLRDKTDYLKKLFQGLDFPEIEVFESPEQHYRMRAEFRIWHEGGEMFYAMFERGQKASGASLIRCDQFPAASESINALMPKLIEAAAQNPEGSFTQPNARVCEKMLGWACDVAQNLGGDLLELYCGNGNFTLPLSQHFRQVLATEVSKTSVYAAQWNIEANRRDNIKIARLSAEEFTEAYTQSREFRRLQEQGISLKDYGFSAIFVDPPRAGVDEETLKLVSQFDNIIYISCNPETLHANLDILCRTHTVKRAALFDQFPFTHHIESGVWLERK